MKGDTAVAKILKMEGVKFVTGFPSSPLWESAAIEDIRIIKARTERVAVNMGDAFSRVSYGQRFGVCFLQSNQGIENAFAGIAQAHDDSAPILLLPVGPARRRIGTPPNFSAVKNYREITKWVDSASFANHIPELMRRAFTYLRMGRPGPVMLELPEDVLAEEFDDAMFKYSPPKEVKSAGDPADVRKVAKALIAAKNPVIRAGNGVLYAGAWDELRELAELLQIPVYTTLQGKSAFPENHPLALGTGGDCWPKMVAHFQNKADLVFAIGSSCTRGVVIPIPDGKVIMQSTIDERDINKDYPIERAIMGDAKLVLRQLIDEVKEQIGPEGKKGNDAVAREVKAVKDEWLKEWMPKFTSDEVPINPYRLIWDLMKALDRKETIITHDSGYPRRQLVPFYESIIPGSYIGWGKSTTLGSSLGYAMGARLARPDKTAVHFTGDAGFGMVGMDFETAVRERVPILTILLNNSLLAGYDRRYPVASERYQHNIISGDYAKVAEGLGGYSETVVQPNDIIPALQRGKKAVDSGQAALIEFITKQERDVSRY